MTTHELDEVGRRYLERHGAKSAPKLTYNFPGTTCISVNEQAAHGIPGERVLAAADLVNIDVSAELDGYFADTEASNTRGWGLGLALVQGVVAAHGGQISLASAPNSGTTFTLALPNDARTVTEPGDAPLGP